MSKRAKVILMVVSGIIVGLLLAVTGWVRVKSRDIAPPDVSDLAVETVEVPDEDNGYVYFERTVDSFDWPEDDRQTDSILFKGQWDEEYVTGLLSRNAQTLARVRQGLACREYQPREEPKLEAPKLPYMWLPRIAKLMALETVREKRAGRVRSAWESCLDRCRLFSLSAICPRGVVEYAVSSTALCRALDEINQLLVESAAQEKELVRLSEALDNVGSLDQGMVRAIKEESQLIAEVIDSPGSGRARRSLFSGYVFQPNRTKRMCAEFFRAGIQVASQPYAQVRVSEFEALPQSEIQRRLLCLRRNGAGRILVGSIVSANTIMGPVRARCLARSRLDGLRLVVACRLYEIRYGRLPETLDALVPEFLREVPRDPFDGKPFRYLPEKAVVYSVGRDMRDSSGSVPRASDADSSGRARRNGDDLVYPIHAGPK